MRRRWLLLWALVVPVFAGAQAADQQAARQKAREYLTARGPWDASGLTTSIHDCRTDVPVLDGYTPASFIPLAEMPRAQARGFFLVAAGAYEMEAACFGLRAGAYRPSQGDGYLYAPLPGVAAQQVHDVLWNWAQHPQIGWQAVQHLIRALESRVHPQRLPPDLRPSASALLGEQGLAEAGAAARGPEPQLEVIDPKLLREFGAAGAGLGRHDPAAASELESASEALDALTAHMERGEPVDPGKLTAAVARVARAHEAALKPAA